MRMLFLGPIIKTIRGISRNSKLEQKKLRLQALTKGGPLSLVPKSFRPCAEVRLRVAECAIADTAGRPGLEAEAVRLFEDVRNRGLEAMMNQAATEPVTRDEMIRLVHTLDEYARAAQAEIEQAEARNRQALASLEEKLKTQSEGVRRLAGLTEQALQSGKECSSALRDIQTSIDRNGARLMCLGVLSVLQWGCIIYLLVR